MVKIREEETHLGYDYNKWRDRIRNRFDISSYLTHLTKEFDGGKEDFSMDSVDVLLKILKERKIKSSNKGFINDGKSVVCFQDAPLYGISQNVKHEILNRENLGNKNRYEPIGICISKEKIFSIGGRPVIYEKPEFIDGVRVFKGISKELLWRVVSIDLSDRQNYIDWTHEREWRVKGDVDFELNDIYIILADHSMYRRFIEKVESEIINSIRGIIVLESILY